MVDQSVTHACLVNIAWLGIVDLEMLVAAMSVHLLFELLMKSNEIVHQVPLELLHIALVSFTLTEFSPGEKEIINRNYSFKIMTQIPARSAPPPHDLARYFALVA